MVFVILMGLFGFFLFLASIPIDLKFQFDSFQSPRFRCRIGWFFSLIELNLPAERRFPGKKKKRRKTERKSIGGFSFFRLLSRPLLIRSMDFTWKIRRTIHWTRLRGDIKAGLGEPADTGILFGYFSAVLPLFDGSDERRLRWEPDFGDEPLLEGTSEGVARLRPIEIIPVVLAFIFSKPVLQAMRRGLRQWRKWK